MTGGWCKRSLSLGKRRAYGITSSSCGKRRSVISHQNTASRTGIPAYTYRKLHSVSFVMKPFSITASDLIKIGSVIFIGFHEKR